MSTQAKLGNALFQSLIKLKEQKGGFDMEDVGALFEEISANLHPAHEAQDAGLKEEIERLAIFIKQAKQEIANIGTSETGENATTDAAQHLDAVIKTTEEASHAIMDAADAIMSAAGGIGGDKEKAIMDATTKIYEACNFQDLTGQRVTKVIKMLTEIDARINHLLGYFGGAGGVAEAADQRSGDHRLLNGPQLPTQAPSQADIDALFAGPKA